MYRFAQTLATQAEKYDDYVKSEIVRGVLIAAVVILIFAIGFEFGRR